MTSVTSVVATALTLLMSLFAVFKTRTCHSGRQNHCADLTSSQSVHVNLLFWSMEVVTFQIQTVSYAMSDDFSCVLYIQLVLLQ